jgi:hypothetical protein
MLEVNRSLEIATSAFGLLAMTRPWFRLSSFRTQRSGDPKSREPSPNHWIPACAGMTDVDTLEPELPDIVVPTYAKQLPVVR